MDIIFKVTSHETSTASSINEEIGIGFISHGEEFKILNGVDIAMNDLTPSEKELAEDFVEMMRAKVLSS